MTAFFESIVNGFQTVIDFISSGIAGVLSVFKLLGDAVVFTAKVFTWLPSFVLPFALATVGVAAVFLIAGRNHGG